MINKEILNELKTYIKENYIEIRQEKYSNALYSAKEFSGSVQECVSYADESCVSDDINEKLKEIDESFSDSVLRIIRENNYDDIDVYRRANLDRRLFSKVRNSDYQPSKETAIALCIGLKLNLEESNLLLNKAGYSLSKSNKFDVIIEYFLSKQIYDISLIDEALLTHDQKTLSKY